MEARELKDKASQLFTKGKFAKAAETYEEFCVLDKKDHQARLRCGDAWAKAGKKDKACGAYAMAAEGFAKDGFLPRAIAASKLVLELDPAHKGVQKMLADLYAQKGNIGPSRNPVRVSSPSTITSSPSRVGAAPAAGPVPVPAPEMEISRGVAAPVTSSFANRKDAIDLDAPLPAARKPTKPSVEAPSPMNRADALELPEYEIPMDDGGGAAGGHAADRGPSPDRRADAIEIETEVSVSDGPKALTETSIEIDLTAGQPVSGEVEIPIEGQPLPDAAELPPELQMGTPLVPAAPPDPVPSVPVFELTVEVGPPTPAPAPEVSSHAQVPLPPASSSNVYELKDELDAPLPRPAPSYELKEELDAPLPRPAPSSGVYELKEELDAPLSQPVPSSGVYELKEELDAPLPQPVPSAPVYELIDVEVPPAPAPPPEDPPLEAAPPAPVRAAEPPPASPPVEHAPLHAASPAPAEVAPTAKLPPAVGSAATAPPGIRPVSASTRPPAVGDAASAPPGIKPVSATSLPPAVGDAASAPPAVKPLAASDGGLPPGLKPKKAEAAAPPASRIWIPPAFTPPAASQGMAPAAAAEIAPEAEAEPSTDLERSLQAFMQFDPDAPQPRAAKPAAEAPAASKSFTELDLDETDSLLHTVDAASRTAEPAAVEEEAMEAPDEGKLEPGALPKIPLFSDLPEDAFIALFEKCPLQRFDEGQLVFEQGDKADAFYVICGGQVRVFRTDGGQRNELATLEEGSFFGEMALLSGAPRSASVEAAAEDTQVLVISSEILTELSAQHPVVATALKKFCRQRMLSNLMNTAALFAPFNRSDRRDLVQKFRARDVKRGDVLVKEGTPSDGLYVILSGEVEIEMKGARVATLKEGQLFGEMSLLMRSPAAATVRALRHTSLLRLPKQDFDMLILSHPQVLEHVATLIDERKKADQGRDEDSGLL